MAETWECLGERELLRVGERLRVFTEHVRLPDGREVLDYLQLRGMDFVCIVAQTEEGAFIVERQYKHGAKREILTLSAGGINAGEQPLMAAKRELLEETGYASDEWASLGESVLHANAGGAPSHAFLAKRCRKIAEPNSGDLEQIHVELKTAKQLFKAACTGRMALATDVAAVLRGFAALNLLELR